MNELLIQLTRIADALERIADGGQLGRRLPDELVRALEHFFGGGTFTVAGILELVAEDPYHPLTQAVGRAVDLNLSSQARATKLGQILAGLSDLELVGERRGAAVYRLVRP